MLVGDRADPVSARGGDVARVHRRGDPCQRQANHGARAAREAEVDEPARPRRAATGRQRVDDQPPHGEAGVEERRVLDPVNQRMGRGVVEDRRDRPHTRRKRPERQGDPGARRQRDQLAGPASGGDQPQPTAAQAERQDGCPKTQHEQRRRDVREQDVLEHVRREQVVVADRVERRHQSDRDDREPAAVRQPVPDAGSAVSGVAAGALEGAAVEPGRSKQNHDQSGVYRPRGPGWIRHASWRPFGSGACILASGARGAARSLEEG